MSRSMILAVLTASTFALPAHAQQGLTYNLTNLHTYLRTPDGINYDYDGARLYARSLGGYLVSINDVSEEVFVYTFFQGVGAPSRWIGLTDEAAEGVFLWDSGEPFGYSYWGTGEPNNFGGMEDWVEIVSNGLWNDNSSPPFDGLERSGIVELAYGDRVNFDVQTVNCTGSFPTPLGAGGDVEGVSWNGAGGPSRPAIVTTIPSPGMPCSGTKFMRIFASGGVTSPPLGGPFPRPAALLANEVRIPVPPGAKGISLGWDFHNGENALDPNYNDGVSIDIVDASGVLIQNLAYADTSNPFSTTTYLYCSPSTAGHPILPVGAKRVSAFLPVSTAPLYLSIVCWNANDNGFTSAAHVDAIQFWGYGPFKLTMSAPFGPGSIRLVNSSGGANNPYWTAVTLSPGAFPYDWFFGIGISSSSLISQVASGTPPFAGTLNALGSSTYTIPSGVPPGIQVYAVSVRFTPSFQFISASSPEFFLTF